MLRNLILALLVTAATLPAVASAAPDLCSKTTVCPIVETGDHYACAGLGVGLQGVLVCGNTYTGCVTVTIGINRVPVCALISLP